MSTWELYFLLILPSIRETILGLSTVTLLIAALGAFFFHHFAEDDDHFSDWATHEYQGLSLAYCGDYLGLFHPY